MVIFFKQRVPQYCTGQVKVRKSRKTAWGETKPLTSRNWRQSELCKGKDWEMMSVKWRRWRTNSTWISGLNVTCVWLATIFILLYLFYNIYDIKTILWLLGVYPNHQEFILSKIRINRIYYFIRFIQNRVESKNVGIKVDPVGNLS